MTDTEKLDLLLVKVGSMESKVDSIGAKVGSMETKVGSMEAKIDSMETRMTSIEDRMDSVESKLNAVVQDVKIVKLVMENEVRFNVKCIAEGHMNLSRKLGDALQKQDEIELLTVRVNVLDTDVNDLKRKIS